MRNTAILLRKEFRSYFDSPVAYVFIIAFLSFTSWIYFRGFFLLGQLQMRDYFFFLPWVFLIFIPAITMRLWAEERKIGTIEILMTLPVKDGEVVVGKYLASFCFLLVTLMLTFPIPVTLALLGNVDMGPIIGGYVGACLLGAAYLAIGIFISSISENQIVAFIIASLVSFALFILGEDIVLFNMPGFLVEPFSFLGLGRHFTSMQRGVLDSRDLIYYLTVIWFFLTLTTRLIASRRWS